MTQWYLAIIDGSGDEARLLKIRAADAQEARAKLESAGVGTATRLLDQAGIEQVARYSHAFQMLFQMAPELQVSAREEAETSDRQAA